ncbi:hypothetical protein [Streptomyces sp. MNP-20]|uniref:hypothetical protein n=1 Tax=Streptomyces sp. MNP-20 TaxID=2721165 RepID=UPI0015558248|nr:hypothetical protein [Streptomyces sp. MNP-20]
MSKFTVLAKKYDLSKGFEDFFGTIGVTGAGLVSKAVAAVLVIIGARLAIQAAKSEGGQGLRKAGEAVGALVVAISLVIFGDDLFATLPTA